MRHVARALGLAVLVVALIGGRHLANVPVNPRDASPVTVEIPEGAGAKAIAAQLHRVGVLRSPLGFLLHMQLSRARGTLQAGSYTFTRAESGGEILRRLVAGDALPADRAVTVPEGFTLREIADRLAAAGIVEHEAFLTAARVERFREEFSFLAEAPDGSLEGYLFPDTYRFFTGSEPDVVVRKFLERFAEQYNRVRSAVGEPVSKPLRDIVTMASIVEREVRSLEDRRLVAGILWSRLDSGVALEADATVRYAVNDWERPLTVNDLAVDSPYNTRRFAGLPPGPIGNPGADSLRATLGPKASEYFYYLSARDGNTIFSKTLEEHNAAVRTHLRK